MEERLLDPQGRAAVAVRVGRLRHGRISLAVPKETASLCDDAGGIRADYQACAVRNALGPLRRLPEHQHRLAEGEGLLLQAAGAREDEGRDLYDVNPVEISHRLDQIDALVASQDREGGLPDDRIFMDGKDHGDVRMPLDDL